jgi:hypothetical protein
MKAAGSNEGRRQQRGDVHVAQSAPHGYVRDPVRF